MMRPEDRRGITLRELEQQLGDFGVEIGNAGLGPGDVEKCFGVAGVGEKFILGLGIELGARTWVCLRCSSMIWKICG